MIDTLTASDFMPGMVVLIPRSQIRPYKGQPREEFDPEDIQDLKRSIQTIGQRTPVTVNVLTAEERVGEDPNIKFELCAGERRWRATGLIDPNYPLQAIIKAYASPREKFVDAFVENIGREEMRPLEIAHDLQRLMDEDPTLTRAELAKICAKNEAWVSQHLSLLKLDPKVQAMLKGGRKAKDGLPRSVAVMLVPFPAEEQVSIASQVVEKKMRYKDARALIGQKMTELDPVSVDGRRARPSDRYREVGTFLYNLESNLDHILSIKSPEFARMFEGRDPDDRNRFARRARHCKDKLASLYEILANTAGRQQIPTVPVAQRPRRAVGAL